MAEVTESIDVDVPVTTAYNQWTQFESFPSFMSGVERVSQLTDTRTHWQTNINGVRREFDAEITEQHPDERIAWRTVDGPFHAGVVTFHRISDGVTRIMVQMEYAPEGVTESVGNAIGVFSRRVEGDLERFKEFLESRRQETGAWRGNVQEPPSASRSL